MASANHLSCKIERHCRRPFAQRFSGCATSGRILCRVTAIAASRMHAYTDSCALAKPKRATWVDVEATGGLSRAVMDVGRLKFREIPCSPPRCRYFQPVLHSLFLSAFSSRFFISR